MGNYQTFRGDPENKLFYLLDSLIGGINTEFSDDASSDTDFESIVNFDVDKLGTLTKRNGFGKIKGLANILQRGDLEGYKPHTDLPWVLNITDDIKNIEETNDNLVYVKLLRNDNNCFRNLAAFESPYEYQKQYGFQNNEFILMLITTKVSQGKCVSSKAWYYHCLLPEVTNENTNTLVFKAYNCNLPVIFTWNKTLMNMDSVEYYSNIWFTNNDKALVRFDRSAEITSNENLSAAFHYVGVVEGKDNEAYTPAIFERVDASFGMNMLCTDPLHDLKMDKNITESLQGAYFTTVDKRPIEKTIPVAEPLLLYILYTSTGTGAFNVTAKNGTTDLKLNVKDNTEFSTANIKVFEISFQTVPNGEVEFKIERTDTDLVNPYYFYVNTGELDPDLTPIENLNIGNCGMCMMSDNRVAYYREDVIFFSDINYPDYITPNNYLKLPLEPTDKITKMCYFKGVYIVFTKERIYKLTGNWNSSDVTLEPVNTSLGCHAPHTVVPIEDVLYFASPRGLYALKSSTFVEGMQNLVELDIKVKKLTSDFTLYEDELSSPSIRFNGINEKAYALRYRDKYMLFFNSSYEKGDYAAKNNLDVLVYDYTLKAFTTYSFVEKPTFLFLIDGALQTFSTTLEDDKIKVEEQNVINYDMTTQETGSTTIKDSSPEGNDGVIEGDLTVNQPSYALGDFDYIETNIKSNKVDLVNDLDINLDMKLLENQENKTIFKAIGKGLEGSVSGYSGEVRSEIKSGYEAVLRYDVIYNGNEPYTLSNTYINFTLTLNRTSIDVLPNVTGKVSISDVFNGIENLIDGNIYNENGELVKGPFKDIEFSSNFADALSVELMSETLYLNIEGGVTETQSRQLKLNLDITSHNAYSYYEKGANVTGTDYRTINEVNWIKFGVPYSVVAYDGYARFTVTKPYIYHNGQIIVASRTFTVSVAGKSMSFTMPAFTSSTPSKGTVYATGTTTKYVDIPYSEAILKGDGIYNVTVKASWAFKDTLSSKYYASLNSSFALTLPTIKLIEGVNTENTSFEVLDTYTLTYIASEEYLLLKLKLNPSDRPEELLGKNVLHFEITDYKSGFGIYCYPIDDINQRHIYNIKRLGSIIQLTCDGNYIGEVDLPDNYLGTRDWTSFLFGTDQNKENYLNWEFFTIDFGIFKYNSIGNSQINETQVQLIDKSGNNNDAIAYGAETIQYDGIFFTGGDSYIKLPTMEYNFQRGFILETKVLLKPNDKSYKIFDAASGYGNANSADNKGSINVTVYDGFVSLHAMTKELVEMSVSTKNQLEYNRVYNIKFSCERVDDTNYKLSVYVDGELSNSKTYRNLTIISTTRSSCFLGKSNNENDDYFKGTIYSFKLSLQSFETEYYLPSTIYEFDTSYSDFDKPIYYELQTKGINLQYPQHIKKLKHIFIKAKGGYKPNDLIFELYRDGYLENDPKIYHCYVDETGKVVYDYTEVSNLTIDERVSVLGNMRLGDTRLGEGNYQTIKMVVPSKGKNFKIKMYGKNKDYMSLESFGFVSKLGKVKQD